MSNLAYLNLTNFAQERLGDPSIVKKALSIALGIALSRSIQLPSSAVESAENYYIDSVAVQVGHMAADFNEQTIVDLDLAVQTARAYWLIRYNTAFPAEVIQIPSQEDGHFMSALVGVGHLINQSTYDFCKARPQAMISLINRVREITDQMA